MYKIKLYSSQKKKKESSLDKEDKEFLGKTLMVGGGIGLLTTDSGHLTGKVTRYHNTDKENVKSILKEGLKTKYSEDPNNLTNKVLLDVPMDKKKGLIYTSKTKSGANDAGATRTFYKKHGVREIRPGDFPEIMDEYKHPKHTETLKLEFDYDDLKNKKRIENPEFRGSKNWKEWLNKGKVATEEQAKATWKSLNDDTHIFDHDIDPSHIKGSKTFKKRTLKDVKRYIKNNPGRFGKEVAKVTASAATLGVGGHMLAKELKKDKEKQYSFSYESLFSNKNEEAEKNAMLGGALAAIAATTVGIGDAEGRRSERKLDVLARYDRNANKDHNIFVDQLEKIDERYKALKAHHDKVRSKYTAYQNMVADMELASRASEARDKALKIKEFNSQKSQKAADRMQKIIKKDFKKRAVKSTLAGAGIGLATGAGIYHLSSRKTKNKEK